MSHPRRPRHAATQRRLLKIRPRADAKLKKVFAGIGAPAPRPFTPDDFQIQALKAIRRSDCLVTAPTGAGKTWIAVQAMRQAFDAGGRAWYASPLKALSNAKYAEFSSEFGTRQVGILTGDRQENPQAPLIVGTTEILRNQLYDAMHRGETLQTDFVVLDEAHFLGDTDRGVVWEEILIYLPARINILLLSATIGNAGQIADWISSIRFKACRVVEETRRPVPLYPLFLHPSGMLLPLLTPQGSGTKPKLSREVRKFVGNPSAPRFSAPRKLPPFGDILRVLRKFDLLPAIFFLKSRADCDNALERCTDNLIEDSGRRDLLGRRLQRLVQHHPHVARHRQLWHLEHLAVGAHHSGQLPIWKLAVETLMAEGYLDAVFATSTVAAGVNYPARTIVFLNSDRFNGREFVPLSPTEFHQMTGRAGRRGMDRIGFALVLPEKFMDLGLCARLFSAKPGEVLSQIKINFSMVLNLLLSHTPDQIAALLEKSLAAYQLAQERRTEPGAAHDLQQDFERHLRFLQLTGYVTAGGEPTPAGQWASQLRVDQPLMIAEGLRRGLFAVLDPARLAAVITAFVNEKDLNEHLEHHAAPKPLRTAFFEVKHTLQPFAESMLDRGFTVRPMSLRAAAAVYQWASGQSWEKVVALIETAEGDLASLVLRTADNLRHIRSLSRVFPQMARTAAAAVDLLLRSPVVMDYVL